VILTNVQVLAAGTKIDRETDKDKPMPVSVVTLLVDPDQSERLTLAASEGKIQLALRNPLDQGAPETPGIKTATMLGALKAPVPVRQVASGKKSLTPAPVTNQTIAAPLPTVEVIRGDKRSAEVIR
jgi:pilus assembly protein CpaB